MNTRTALAFALVLTLPLLAAWVPNIIFTFIAWYLYKRAPK